MNGNTCRQIITSLVVVIFLLAACTTAIKTTEPAMTATYHYVTPIIIEKPIPIADALTALLYFSDPELPQYDPQSTQYAQFPEVVKQLGSMGSGANDAADDLAVAITFPRPDAYLAAQALLELGPEITSLDLPILISELAYQKPQMRVYAVILLGSTGKLGSCSVGYISPLLWDPDAYVRTAAAIALEKITGENLVESQYKLLITPSFLAGDLPPDTPEGTVVGKVRDWWSDQGSKINWHPSYDICDP